MESTLFKPIDILLIEDNPGDVRLCREAFRDAKIANSVEVAENGRSALQILKEPGRGADAVPDVILLDLNLPDMDGRDVLEALKSNPRWADIPVVILSASQAHSDIMESYGLQASGYIVKPVDFDKLRAAVNSIGRFWFAVVKENERAAAG
jgi:CheY-like chemotaxis protein